MSHAPFLLSCGVSVLRDTRHYKVIDWGTTPTLFTFQPIVTKSSIDHCLVGDGRFELPCGITDLQSAVFDRLTNPPNLVIASSFALIDFYFQLIATHRVCSLTRTISYRNVNGLPTQLPSVKDLGIPRFTGSESVIGSSTRLTPCLNGLGYEPVIE